MQPEAATMSARRRHSRHPASDPGSGPPGELWLADRLGCRTGWLTGWLAGWLSGWLAGWLAGWKAGRLTGSQAACLLAGCCAAQRQSVQAARCPLPPLRHLSYHRARWPPSLPLAEQPPSPTSHGSTPPTGNHLRRHLPPTNMEFTRTLIQVSLSAPELPHEPVRLRRGCVSASCVACDSNVTESAVVWGVAARSARRMRRELERQAGRRGPRGSGLGCGRPVPRAGSLVSGSRASRTLFVRDLFRGLCEKP